MNCLVCGHKLAIFRKLSLGDFCSQEHRSFFLKDQSDLGLARLMETGSEPGEVRTAEVRTRGYAQFQHEELPASPNGAHCLGHGPLAQVQVIGPETQRKQFTRLAPAKMLECAEPQVGAMAPMYFEAAGISLRLPGGRLPVWMGGAATRLHRAGLILPWSSGAGPQVAFSLAPLAAAAWAQPGYSKLMRSTQYPRGSQQFAWPRVDAKVELPALVKGMAPAVFATGETPAPQPARVHMSTPRSLAHEPRLRLPVPPRVPIEDYPAGMPISPPAAGSSL